MSSDPIRTLSLSVAEVTDKTSWIFVTLETASGLRGTGEATLVGQNEAVSTAVDRLAPEVFADAPHLPCPVGLAEAAAVSALDQALWDVAARRRGTDLATALGEVRRRHVPLYANINRRTIDRSPAGFAHSAADALAAGHEWFKIAPFDEVKPAMDGKSDAIAPGLARIAAVRDEIGPERRLMVDCHWRLDEPSAARVIAAAADLGVHWVECPLPEDDAHMAALVRLRGEANRRGVLLAGMEHGIGVAGFAPFIAAGAYDVMMPDVKYVGGLAEVLRLADAMRAGGVAFSPHNPTGPVCHAVSLQLCGVIADLDSLETQFDETPWFEALAGAKLQTVEHGIATLRDAPGIGMTLQEDALAACRSTHWVRSR